jgi:SAM-dependent methyltransferase
MPPSALEFSSVKHRHGAWNTRAVAGRNPLVRALCRYMSFKRALVDDCAKTTPPHSLVLDLGCGTGAYLPWFSARTPSVIVGVDWSLEALRLAHTRGCAMAVCADATRLPFKPEIFDAAYSVDMLGHVLHIPAVLDELLRTVRPGARIAMHSECSDAQAHWPDRSLIARLGSDVVAERDGHCSVWSTVQLRDAYTRRFKVAALYSPAGLLGWLTGYPDKYLPAMVKAGWWLLIAPVWILSIVKNVPLIGWLMRFLNITTNHLEVALGLEGGGSCFALLEKPTHTRSQ